MHFLRHVLPLALLVSAGTAAAQSTAGHVIRLDQPTSFKGAESWWGGHPERFDNLRKPVSAGDAAVNPDPEWERRSLPLGNGHLGANLMGSVATERLTLNEKSLWRGGPGVKSGPAYYWDVNKDSAPVLKAIRRAFTEGNGQKAAQLTRENFNGKASYETQGEKDFRFGSFTTMGELHIATGLDEAKIRDYERTLSVDSAFATVNFTTARATPVARLSPTPTMCWWYASRPTAADSKTSPFPMRRILVPRARSCRKAKMGWSIAHSWTTTACTMWCDCARWRKAAR